MQEPKQDFKDTKLIALEPRYVVYKQEPNCITDPLNQDKYLSVMENIMSQIFSKYLSLFYRRVDITMKGKRTIKSQNITKTMPRTCLKF